MTVDTPRDALHVGPKLRALRLEQHLSLRALAARTGFSASFLSQVELGQTSPSLLSLDRIATTLGLSLPALLSSADGRPGPVLRRKGEAAFHSEWSRAMAQSLLPAGVTGGVMVVFVRLEPGGRTGKSPHPPAGRELAFCVRGRPTLVLGAEPFVLGAGDSIFYDAAQPVVWRNQSARIAELLLVTLPAEGPARRRGAQ